MEFVKRIWRDQSGNVESALVVIPLMALFLISVQLIVAVNFRNIEQSYAQGSANQEAISGIVPNSDEVVSFSSWLSSNDFRLVISHRERLLPRLIPGLPSFGSVKTPTTDVTGVAVMEQIGN